VTYSLMFCALFCVLLVLPSAEARYISLALYNVIVVSAILLSLIVAFPSQVNVVYGVKTIGSAACAFLSMCILFLPVRYTPLPHTQHL
jgi:hypothetical protein